MKTLSMAGLFLFLLGFLNLNGLTFLSDYVVTEQIVERAIADKERIQAFLGHAGQLLTTTHPNSFESASSIENVLNSANRQLLKKYSVTDQDVDRILSYCTPTFTQTTLDSAFARANQTSEFHKKAFTDYGSSYFGAEVTRNQLLLIADKVNRYEVTGRFGFDRYRIRDLKLSITKASARTPIREYPLMALLITIGLCIAGGAMFMLAAKRNSATFSGTYHNLVKSRGWLGGFLGAWLIAFYIVLYFYPEHMTAWIILVDPISMLLKEQEAGRFFLYGFLYTVCVLVMGLRMLLRHRGNRYQTYRTFSVMFFQTSFAFVIPEMLLRLHQPYFDFKNIWPLDYDFFFDNELNQLLQSGSLGIFMLVWGVALVIIGVPIFTYFYGKRWYCSWVCGCGGLAETLGDPFRHLSDKSLKAWKIERWAIHGVLVLAIVMTAGVLITFWTRQSTLFGFINTYQVRELYGFLIGSVFAGVVGTGFYPMMGNRVWCRFGCPLAAYIGFVQRFKSRFRITTNGGQCISCGNCSAYCEMGIDVKWYAQRGQDIVRSSCVGCGICSAVCPRGVLRLENTSSPRRI